MESSSSGQRYYDSYDQQQQHPSEGGLRHRRSAAQHTDPLHHLPPTTHGGGPQYAAYDPGMRQPQDRVYQRQPQQQVYQQQPQSHSHSLLMPSQQFQPQAPAAAPMYAFGIGLEAAAPAQAHLNPLAAVTTTTTTTTVTNHNGQSSTAMDPLEELLFLHNPVSDVLFGAVDPPAMQAAAAPSMMMQPPPQQPKQDTSVDALSEELARLSLELPGLSLEPLSGAEIVSRVRDKLQLVQTRYLPCVDFLVTCQQELRKGLAHVQHQQAKQRSYPNNHRRRSPPMTPPQFYSVFVDPLPTKFYRSNAHVMDGESLQKALQGLQKLAGDAQTASASTRKSGQRYATPATCDGVKNAFLGGMKDGASWGLRKWLSDNGAALTICTDVECIHQAVQKLERSADTTRQLAAILRPMAQQTLNRLREHVPASYQEQSSAHPYLPFFHRLEAALRSMAQYNPEEEQVICLVDDSDDDEEPVVVQPVVKRKRRAPAARRRNRASATASTVEGGGDDAPVKRYSQTCTLTDSAIVVQRQFEQPAKETRTIPPPLAKPKPQQQQDGNCSSSSGEEADDDSVVEVVGFQAPPAAARKDDSQQQQPPTMQQRRYADSTDGLDRLFEDTNVTGSAKSDDGNEDWKCMQCSMINASSTSTCLACGEERDVLQELLRYSSDAVDDIFNVRNDFDDGIGSDLGGNSGSDNDPSTWGFGQSARQQPQQVAKAVAPSPLEVPAFNHALIGATAKSMAQKLDQLATLFEQERQSVVRPVTVPMGSFWDGVRYAEALHLFSRILRRPEAPHFIEPINDARLVQTGNPPFSHVVKHPLCFREVVTSLVDDPVNTVGLNCRDGCVRTLPSWNMWYGMDLLQAIDLVFLNSLAYGKHVDEGKSQYRSQTNGLRKFLWQGIQQIVQSHVGDDPERRRMCTPTRRSESSGFVVYKS